jgi:CRISPR-associated protein Cas1
VQLIINTFGSALRKQGEQFLIQAGNQRLAVSAHKVQSIVLTTAVQVTTDALELAIVHNIDVLLLNQHGDPLGRFWQTRMGSTAAIRRRQLEVAMQPEGLELARGWVEAKLRHQQEFLEELARRRPDSRAVFDSALGAIRASIEKLGALTGTLEEQRNTVMGLEGSAGRAYFACLGRLVPEAYRFEGRSRQPAIDEFNAMLNYAYGVLYGLVERACLLAALDPGLGLLHTDNYSKPSLVYDLIEPFRILGDRAVVLLFTGRRVLKEWFEPVPGGVALSKEGRAAFLSSLNERLDRRVRYAVRSKPGKSRNIKQRDVIGCEAHALANLLLGRKTCRGWSRPGSSGPRRNRWCWRRTKRKKAARSRRICRPWRRAKNADLGGLRHLEGSHADEDRPAVPGLWTVPRAEERLSGRRAEQPGGGDPAVQPRAARSGNRCGVCLPHVQAGFRARADRGAGV